MLPKERMQKAMSREKPDRVPVMCQMSIGHMLLQTGFSPLEFWHSVELFGWVYPEHGLLNSSPHQKKTCRSWRALLRKGAAIDRLHLGY